MKIYFSSGRKIRHTGTAEITFEFLERTIVKDEGLLQNAVTFFGWNSGIDKLSRTRETFGIRRNLAEFIAINKQIGIAIITKIY